MHKWLIEVAVPSLPAAYHGIGAQVADDVLMSYPLKRIQGLPDLADYTYAMLYSTSPPRWLSDAALRALCLRLTYDYSTVRFAGFQSAVVKQRRSRKTDGSPVDEPIRHRLLQHVKEDGVDTVLLPLNFNNFHWCCVVVKVNAKRIYYYDQLNHFLQERFLMGTAVECLSAGCSSVRPTSHDTMEDDDKEEKTPAPRNAGDDDAGDEEQHTQRYARIEVAEDGVSPTQRAAGVDDAKSEVLPTQPAQ
ncbi:hypothetical protein F442_18418 [Phytophthora nicotianae P10297]|uniref:Ubiquitin-like protease family profile domain-containing protein n=1 Tax=Phytophthora nicotianae P10297 TaxID=1317064 RepID=W2YFK7_PHYNI|nr:hypothetical protein F442_18418 [Phytophthora nicotianae P10297]